MQSPVRRVLRTHGVEIDVDSGRVQRNGNEFFLRQKSQRVLACLLEHRQQPLSKDQLIDLVWNGNALSDEVLTGCIREIRKALGDDARQPTFIRTMPKNGYWFIAPVEDVPVAKEVVETVPVSSPATADRQSPAVDGTRTPSQDAAEPAALAPPALPFSGRWLAAAAGLAAALCAGFAFWPRTKAPHWAEAAWWRLDEGSGTEIRDSVGGRSGQIPHGVFWVPGVNGRALEFRGAETPIVGEDAGLLPRGRAPRTLMAWIKPAAGPPDAQVVFQYGSRGGDEPGDSFFLLNQQGGQAAFGNHKEFVTTRTPINDAGWHQVVGVFDGTKAWAYLDGVAMESGQFRSEALTAEGRTVWSVGRAGWGGTPFRGAVDDIRVFARALREAEVKSLYRCGSRSPGIEVAGKGSYYFSPIFGISDSITAPGEGEVSPRIANAGKKTAGVCLVRRQPDCAWRSTWASDLGQDLEFEMEIRVGGKASGPVASAGPYLRSRRSAPGDGIVGGTSAGYWVELLSTGHVRVKRLYPGATVAFSEPSAGFDAGVFHRLRVVARGARMEVWLDGKPLSFDQHGVRSTGVELKALWDTATPRGTNQGAAGIAFACDDYRHQVGGQEIRNLRVRALD